MDRGIRETEKPDAPPRVPAVPDPFAEVAMHLYRHVKFRGAKPHFIQAQIVQFMRTRMADVGISPELIDRATKQVMPLT